MRAIFCAFYVVLASYCLLCPFLKLVISFMLRRVILSLFWMTLWLVSSLKLYLAAFMLLNTIRCVTLHIRT
jgi:hypothetical protein